jgi:PAS domain S-box-containing protein
VWEGTTSTYFSSLPDDLKINPLTLSFSGDLEKTYRDDYFIKSLGHVRIACLIAIFFYGAFGVLDAYLVPDLKHQLWFIRYALFIPFAFAVFLFSFSRHFKKYMQFCIAAVVIAAGLGIIAMIRIMHFMDVYTYYVGVILVFIFGYTFFKLRFIWASLAGWLLVLAYEIVAVSFIESPLLTILNHNYFFLSSNILCMFAGYSIELSARKEFMQARLLEAEKLKVDNSNRVLEKAVRERTEQLVNANEDLKQEIADKEQAEEALKASEEKYRTIIESIEEGYFELDLAGNVTFCNDSLCSIVGYPREELLGMNNRDYTSPETAKKMFDIFSEVYRTGIPARSSDFEVVRNNGDTIFIEISATLVRDPSGTPVGFRGLLRDVTERKQHEIDLQKSKEAAEAANRAKSDFLANMSHELRTPLHHIMGFTELVVTKCFGELNEVQEEHLNDVLQSSKHLLSLINDVLDLSKIEGGKMEINLSEVHVERLIEQSLLMFKEKAMKHRIDLSIHAEGIPPVINADERKLKQIIYNLLSNAIKFTPDGGTIRLNARQVEPSALADRKIGEGHPDGNGHRYLEFAVVDTGIGITPENQERIFGRFERVDESMNRKYEGTGLGLALSKDLVELHGGRIWVESEGEGKGSAFHFVLPLSA